MNVNDVVTVKAGPNKTPYECLVRYIYPNEDVLLELPNFLGNNLRYQRWNKSLKKYRSART
jgi:hypothetical protein